MLIVTRVEVLQRVRDVEGTSSSERVAATGRHNDRGPVRDGVGVDGEREHQPICESTPGCESI